MNRFFFILLVCLACIGTGALAQGPSDLNAGLQVAYSGSTGAYTLSWWGVAGNTYLIETSDDLVNWSYLPIVETGSDAVIQWGFSSTSSSLFFQLEYIMEPANQLSGVQFYGPDNNGNGLPDDWELFYFGYLGVDPNVDPNGEGFTNLQDYENGNNPIANQVVSVGPCVGEYLFHETSGTIAHDISSLHNNGILSGGAGWATGGYDGQGAVTLDGSTGEVSISDRSNQVFPSAGAPFSFAFWFEPATSLSGTTALVAAGPNGTSGFQLNLNSTVSPPQLVFSTPGAGGMQIVAPIQSENWTQAALTYDGTTAILYVNGAEISSGTGTLISNTNSMTLGQATIGARPFGGALENLTFYQATLGSSDVNNLFNISTTTTGPDPSGLPNWWKYEYYGTLNVDPDSYVTWSGSEMTTSQAYYDSVNPTDFYSGEQPLLSIMSGAGLTGSPNGFIPKPLTVNVTNASGTPLADAPVTFIVSSGSGVLQAASTSGSGNSVTVLTDLDGNAEVFYQLPNAPNTSNEIVADAGPPGNVAQVQFSEASDSGTGSYGSPFVPSNVTGTINPDGTETVNWQNNDETSPIYIYLQSTGGTWSVTGSFPSGTTTYTASAVNAGSIEIGNNFSAGGSTGVAPGNGDPGAKPIVGIPSQSYAVVDLSGTTTTSDISLVALDDSNNALFAYDSNSNTLNVDRWTSGALQSVQSVTIDTGTTYNTSNGQVHQTVDLYPTVLTSNGTLYGAAELGYDYTSWGTQTSFTIGFSSSASNITLLGNSDYLYNPLGEDGDIFSSSDAVRMATNGAYAGKGTKDFYNVNPYGYVSSGGAATYFVENNSEVIPPWLPSGTAQYGPGYEFYPLALNDQGWVAFNNETSTGTITNQLWNGSSLITLAIYPTAINDQDLMVGDVSDQYGNPTGTAVLWEPGTSSSGTTMTFSSLSGPTILQQLLNQFDYIAPEFIGNANPVGNSTQILFSSNDGTPGYVLTLSASNTISALAGIQLPSGVSISDYYGLNASGAIVAIGTLNANQYNNHALLLLPVTFSFGEVVSNPAVFNYIPSGHVGTPKLYTDISITTIPSTAVTLSSTSSGSFTTTTGSTDISGSFGSTFSTTSKAPATFNLAIETGTATSPPHAMLPACYQTTFHITGFYTPSETNFTGPKVTSTTETTGRGTQNWKQYNITSPVAARADFLQNLAIEGEGYLDNGTHVVANNHTVRETSSPVMITSTITTDNSTPQGTYAPLVDGESCAVTVGGPIPPKASIYIVNDQDQRSADDVVAGNESGGLYHIDLYCGFDQSYAETISENNDQVVLYNY